VAREGNRGTLASEITFGSVSARDEFGSIDRKAYGAEPPDRVVAGHFPLGGRPFVPVCCGARGGRAIHGRREIGRGIVVDPTADRSESSVPVLECFAAV